MVILISKCTIQELMKIPRNFKLKNIKLNNIKLNKRELTIIVVSIMVLTLFFSGYSMGKERSVSNISANAEIAEPILIVENNPAIDITATNNVGTYEFKIKNYNKDGKRTEVDLLYNIEILTKVDKSITFELYKDNEKIQMVENKTENMLITKEENIDETYKLKITYDKTKSNSITDIINDVQVKVHSEQAKA